MVKVYDHTDTGWHWLPRVDMYEYFTETLSGALYLWVMWKRFGLPHGRGWMHETGLTLQVIGIVDEERNLFDSKELEARRGNSGRTKSSRKG